MRRNPGVDAVRIVGIVAVVAGHVWNDAFTRAAFYSWHVPLFFFASGYFWTERKRTLRDEVRLRWRTLGSPYVTATAILIIPFLIVQIHLFHNSLIPSLKPILLGGKFLSAPFSAFWFITALFFSCILYRLVDRVPFWVRGLIFLFAIVVAGFYGAFLAKAPFALGTAIPCTFFIWTGQLFRQSERHVRHATLTGLTLLATSAAVIFYFDKPLDLKRGDYGIVLVGPLTAAAVASGLFLVSRPLSEYLRERDAVRLSELAQVGLGVVLYHALAIWALRLDNATLSNWIIFLFALSFSWAAALAVHRSKASALVLGIRRV